MFHVIITCTERDINCNVALLAKAILLKEAHWAGSLTLGRSLILLILTPVFSAKDKCDCQPKGLFYICIISFMKSWTALSYIYYNLIKHHRFQN